MGYVPLFRKRIPMAGVFITSNIQLAYESDYIWVVGKNEKKEMGTV